MNISVVIPNYNGGKYIESCLDSLYLQTLMPDEIIIVDNNSMDKSKAIIKSKYAKVKLISLNKNYGFSRAVNEGLKIAKGKYVILLNNDTKAEVTWVENLYNTIRSNNEIFSCSSKMLKYHDKDLIDDAGDEYTILGWARKRGDSKNKKLYTKSEEVFSSCAGAAIYKRDIFFEIGYFDEKFFAYLEDMDISYRARLFGYINYYCANAVIYHIGSATTGSKHNSFKARLSSRNNVYLIYKNMPLIQIIFNIPFIFIGYLTKLVFFTTKGYGKDYLAGSIEGIKGTKDMSKIKSNSGFMIYFKIQLKLIKNTLKIFSF
ncbi:glycosyltransferase family 2 protein [Clostridium algidicarnis]|uniref:glycosyltransferase family 2 protein n=1 Tax=Clostridium algidicarnis TaxID=37659 RepID=UPI001624FCEB|nr:glycosyltransferase family 2 protein [Clostridium algidicarnis]MBB6698271.1 glycosyltransferase family 2 protein [Clostridium algidicarnis]MBU3197398.1 glycosyltransferase family 2 protein [Clostridium algidicarnis]